MGFERNCDYCGGQYQTGGFGIQYNDLKYCSAGCAKKAGDYQSNDMGQANALKYIFKGIFKYTVIPKNWIVGFLTIVCLCLSSLPAIGLFIISDRFLGEGTAAFIGLIAAAVVFVLGVKFIFFKLMGKYFATILDPVLAIIGFCIFLTIIKFIFGSFVYDKLPEGVQGVIDTIGGFFGGVWTKVKDALPFTGSGTKTE